MTTTSRWTGWGLFATLAAALIAVEIAVSTQLAATPVPALVGTAITLDLVVGLPVVAWVLLVRRKRASRLVLIATAVGGLLLARVLVPAPHDDALQVVGRLAVVVELAVLVAGAVSVRALVRRYRHVRPTTVYGYDALAAAAKATWPAGRRAVRIMLTEVALIGLAVAGWRRRYAPPPGAQAFTTHVRCGAGATAAMACLAMVVETVAVHLLVQRWAPAVAWVLTATSVYLVLWLTGDHHGLRLNPHVVDDRMLHLRAGLRWRADIPRGVISNVRRRRADDADQCSRSRCSATPTSSSSCTATWWCPGCSACGAVPVRSQ